MTLRRCRSSQEPRPRRDEEGRRGQVRAIEDEVARDLHEDGDEIVASSEDAPGAWAGVMRLCARLVGGPSEG